MIESRRLIIRPFSFQDAEEACEWFHDREVMRWIPQGPDGSIDSTRDRIRKYMAHHDEFGFGK